MVIKKVQASWSKKLCRYYLWLIESFQQSDWWSLWSTINISVHGRHTRLQARRSVFISPVSVANSCNFCWPSVHKGKSLSQCIMGWDPGLFSPSAQSSPTTYTPRKDQVRKDWDPPSTLMHYGYGQGTWAIGLQLKGFLFLHKYIIIKNEKETYGFSYLCPCCCCAAIFYSTIFTESGLQNNNSSCVIMPLNCKTCFTVK